ncbi:MAG: hypothetical protein ABI678_05025, partial [Kofleriaceae bacterium]
MTQFWAYRDAFGASDYFLVTFDPDRIRLGALEGLTEQAEHLATGTVTLTFDDPDADLGNAGDALLPQARIRVMENACPVGSQRLYNGIIGAREYHRGPYINGVSRVIEVELHDLNALASMRVIPNSLAAANRPAETVTARMTWIMGANLMNGVLDLGFVAANATLMTANDYRGQRPANVINDCELAAGFGWNAFVYFWDEAASNPGLFFDNANTSTAFTSTLRISNDLADIDTFTDPSAVTFAPSKDARLRRDPSDLGSGVYLPYTGGAVFRERADTVAAYGHKDIIAPNSNVTTKARATSAADDLLFQHSTEEDRITVTVELPPSHVNLVRAGMRMEVKFTHLPGYESFTWCRVLSRSPAQTMQTDDRYSVRLELSPQEAGGCEGDVVSPLVGTVTAHNMGAGTQAPDDPTNANDGNVLTRCNFHAGGDGVDDAKERWITLECPAPITLSAFVLLVNEGAPTPPYRWEDRLDVAATPSPPNQFTRFKWSDDGSTFTDIAVTLTARDGHSPELQTWTFDDGSITAGWWMIYMAGKADNNIWQGGYVYEWGGIGCETPAITDGPAPDPTPPVGTITPPAGGTGTTLDKDF